MPRKDGRWGWLGAVVDPIRLGIIVALSETEEATATDLAEQVGLRHQTLRRHLEALVGLGIVLRRSGETDGETVGRPAARYRLAPEMQKVGRVLRSLAGEII